MGAPARVLRREVCVAPRLALVDNMGIGEDIVAEAQRQNEQYIDGDLPERQVTPVNRNRRRERRPRYADRNGAVITGRVNDVAMGIAELIQNRHGYGYIKIVDANTVLVCNRRGGR